MSEQEAPTEIDRAIGRRIAYFREEVGLTRAELAEQVGTDEEVVEMWEEAKLITYGTDIDRLCRVLDIQPNDLLIPDLQ